MGWKSFEPWLSRLEALDDGSVWSLAEAVPPEWYGGDTSEVERLIEKLLARRGRIRELVAAFRDSDREPFPNWEKVSRVVVPRQFAEAALASKFVM